MRTFCLCIFVPILIYQHEKLVYSKREAQH
jgi:hypothetical protein